MTNQTNQTANLLNITSKPQETVGANELQIVARWKDTDKRPIAANNRARAVILPANIWSAAVNIEGNSNEFRAFMLDAIEDLAKTFLSTIVEESNWMRTQVNADAFNLENLLAWNAVRQAESGRLSTEAIKTWAEQSVTIKTARAARGDAIANALLDQFQKLAGPNHGCTPDRATKILASLWQKDDSANTIGLKVQLRLQSIIDKSNSIQANALDAL